MFVECVKNNGVPSRFILIADRGICNYMNLLHLLDAGNGYVVSKSFSGGLFAVLPFHFPSSCKFSSLKGLTFYLQAFSIRCLF